MSLRELLETERATGIHKPGAVLHDPSGAIALLWMRRTLQFLGRCFQGVVDDVPSWCWAPSCLLGRREERGISPLNPSNPFLAPLPKGQTLLIRPRERPSATLVYGWL